MFMEKLKKQILDCFKDLIFEEEPHKYFVNKESIKYSVSNIVDKFKNPFDKDKIAFFTAKKQGRSVEDVLLDWDTKNKRSIDKGNKTHYFGELYPYNRNLKPQTPQEEAVVKFYNDLPYFIVPLITELKMYHKEYFFAGTADIILYNTQTQKFIIGDYKTNENLFKNYRNQLLKDVFKKFLDNPFNKYQIQLSLYEILFLQTGLEVSHRKIVWLKEDGTYALYDTEDLKNILLNYLKENF